MKIGSTKGIGSIIRCMDLAKYNGQMEEDIKVNMRMIRSMDRARFIGQMEENI